MIIRKDPEMRWHAMRCNAADRQCPMAMEPAGHSAALPSSQDKRANATFLGQMQNTAKGQTPQGLETDSLRRNNAVQTAGLLAVPLPFHPRSSLTQSSKTQGFPQLAPMGLSSAAPPSRSIAGRILRVSPRREPPALGMQYAAPDGTGSQTSTQVSSAPLHPS
ncbi:hypothetical protein VTI74DRAFT_4461 [Chaetomium olivicolor]